MQQYASFFVPARSSMGALPQLSTSTRSKLTVAPAKPLPQAEFVNKYAGVISPSPVSSGVAGRILDLGPVGMIGLVVATAVAGYFIVSKVSR